MTMEEITRLFFVGNKDICDFTLQSKIA